MNTRENGVAATAEVKQSVHHGQPADGIPDGSGSDAHPDTDVDTASGGPAD